MNIRILLMCIASLITTSALAEEIAVVVNLQNEATLSKEHIASFYRGDALSWSGGLPVKLLDLPADNAIRLAFDKEVVSMTAQQLKDLWSRNAITGKGIPPKELASDEEVKKAVAASRFAIGYIKASSVDATVRVAAKF